MLHNDTNRSLAAQVQMKNTQLFGTSATALTGMKATPQFANSSIKKNQTPMTAKQTHQPAAKLRPQMSLGASTNNMQSVSMKMGSSLGAFKSQPVASSIFGMPAQAPTFNASAIPRNIPASSRAGNLNMFAGASVNQGFKNQSFQQPSFLGSLSQQVSISRQPAMKSSGRAPTVVMEATVTKSDAETKSADPNYMDRVVLQQKYDNLDHLDPDVHYTGNQYIEELMKNAKILSTPGKGILASDESNGTCGKRFEAIGVENTEELRNAYRELLYSAKGLEDSVSGCIMYDETIRQNAKDGRTLVKVLGDKGILSGIKVDTGISVIEGTNDETVTNGLDGLSTRASEYYELGARFAKWRAVLKITPDGCPSDVAITETAHSLARYAQICQHSGLVPIVEPEILTDGTHDIKTCAAISEKVFNAVMNELITQKVLLEGMLLKPNMITSGAQAEVQADPEEVAFFTVRTLGRTIPPAVPGITFLSGGQSEEIAAQNLNAINKLADVKHPWTMTYSFGRALQSSVLTTWAGKEENVETAQKRLLERCIDCSKASLGKFEGGSGSTTSDYVANYKY